MSENTVVSIFGQKGSRKTTLAKSIADEYPRVIVLDTLGEYDDTEQQKWAPFPSEMCFGWDSCMAALSSTQHRDRFRLSLRLEDAGDYFDVMEVCYHIPDHLLVLEETSQFCSSAALPWQLSTLVRYGRHRRINQLYVARRPSEIHRDLTAQSDVIVSFRQHEPRDLQYLASVSGADVSMLPTLPDGRCMAFGNLSKAPAAVLAVMVRKSQLDMFEREDVPPAPVADENAIDNVEDDSAQS